VKPHVVPSVTSFLQDDSNPLVRRNISASRSADRLLIGWSQKCIRTSLLVCAWLWACCALMEGPSCTLFNSTSIQRGSHAQARPYKLDTAKVAAMRRQYVAPNHAIMYKEPLHIVRGKGAWLFDNDGNAYLDCVNNVAHVGHSNAKVRVYSRPRSV